MFYIIVPAAISNVITVVSFSSSISYIIKRSKIRLLTVGGRGVFARGIAAKASAENREGDKICGIYDFVELPVDYRFNFCFETGQSWR